MLQVIHHKLTPPRRPGDDGSALVIALVMVFIIGVVAVAIMGYTSTSLRATASVATDREHLYAADGGIDAAIQHIANLTAADPGAGVGYTDGDPCALTVQVPSRPEVDVTCEGSSETTSDGVGDGGINSSQPKFAILTTGRRAAAAGPPNVNNFEDLIAWWGSGAAGEPGVVFAPNWSNQLAPWTLNEAGIARLKGGVFSNSTVVADTGTLQTDPGTTFTTRGGCTVSRNGKILVEGSAVNPNCVTVGYPGAGGYGNDATGEGADPMYPSRIELAGLPAKATMPTCTGNLVTFEPGWYDSATALTNLMRDCKGADGKGADFWFKPGVYLFDFRDTTTPACNSGGGGRVHQWCIGEGSSNPRVVGGTPEGWSPVASVTSPVLNATTASGTGMANAANGAAIDGVSASSGAYSGGSVTLAPATAADNSGWSTPLSAAYAIEGGPFTSSNSVSYTSSCALFICGTGTITLRSYPTTVPAGASVVSASLRVRHRENNTSNISQLRVEVLNASGTELCERNLTATTATDPAPQVIDLTGCVTTAAQANGIRFRLVAQRSSALSGSVQFQLDGMALDLTYGNAQPNVTVGGFGANVPADATSLSVNLVVEQSASVGVAPQVVLNGGLPSCTINLSAGSGTYNVSGCLNTPAKINAASATYGATLTNGQSVSLDGMRLELSYAAATRPTFPAACNDDQPGVQFVFAGDSRVRFVDGTMNLCAGPPAGSSGQPGYTAQQIAIYGIRPLPTLAPSAVTSSGSGITNPENAVIMAEQPTNESAPIQWSASLGQTRDSSTISFAVPGLADENFPALPANTRVTGVTLRAQYNGFYSLFGSIIGGNPQSPRVRFLKNGSQLCENGSLPVSGWDTGVWGDMSQQTVDVTNCFLTSGQVDLNKLRDLEVEWRARASCGILSILGCNFRFDLDGFELELTLAPVNTAQPAAIPQQGCIIARPNYGRGNADNNDKSCALLKWGPDSGNGSGVFLARPTDPHAMVQINGTVYAPGAALDIAEFGKNCESTRQSGLIAWLFGSYCTGNVFSGVNYPVIDRGIVARHVRIRGLKLAPGYDGYLIGCGRNDCGLTALPNPKLVTLRATVEGATAPRVEAEVCFGPISSTQITARDVPTSDGRWCTGDGTGSAEVVRWRDLTTTT